MQDEKENESQLIEKGDGGMADRGLLRRYCRITPQQTELEIFRSLPNTWGKAPEPSTARNDRLAQSPREPNFPWFYGTQLMTAQGIQLCSFKLLPGLMNLFGWVTQWLAGARVVLVSSFQLVLLVPE